jgi:Sugar (and other) transporter
LAGIGHGVIYLTTIVHGSEILVNNNRGMVIAGISWNMVVVAAAIVSLNMGLEDASTIDPNRVLGILQLSIVVLAGLLGAFLTYESPVYLLQRDRDSEAKSVMMILRSETTDTHELLADLHDLKTLVAEEDVFITSLFRHGNMRPLLTIAVLRILNVLTFNFPLNFVRVVLSVPAFTFSTQFIIMLVRAFVGAFTLLTFDCVPRRVYFFISGFGSFAALALLTIFYQIDSGMGVWSFAGVVLVYDAMAALAIPQLTDIYSAEAFPLSKKFDSLCAVKLVENLLQAGLVMTMVDMEAGRDTILAILYTFTILIGAAVIFLAFRLPETLNKSIRETRDLFRGNVRNLTM